MSSGSSVTLWESKFASCTSSLNPTHARIALSFDHFVADVSITAELGLLFHLMGELSVNGMIQPDSTARNSRMKGQVKAFVPSNFIAAFPLLPEATNLALVDGVAGAAEIARRPEAFYRFL